MMQPVQEQLCVNDTSIPITFLVPMYSNQRFFKTFINPLVNGPKRGSLGQNSSHASYRVMRMGISAYRHTKRRIQQWQWSKQISLPHPQILESCL